jgi:hypothetical protein
MKISSQTNNIQRKNSPNIHKKRLKQDFGSLQYYLIYESIHSLKSYYQKGARNMVSSGVMMELEHRHIQSTFSSFLAVRKK